MTEEEERAAKRIEGLLLGQDPDRILLDRAPNTVTGFLKFTTDRIEQCLKILVDMEFAMPPSDFEMRLIPEEDRRRHLAKICLEGIRAYDQHYNSFRRFNRKGKPWGTWTGKL